jgi:alpha-1,2-mannosyltransferase
VRGRFAAGAGQKSARAPLWREFLGRVILLALVAAAMVLLVFVLDVMARTRNATWDFDAFYAAGRIILRGSARNLYSLPLQQQVEVSTRSLGRFLPFYHPPFEAWLYLPLAYVPYRLAYLLWTCLNLLVLVLSLYFLRFSGYWLNTEGFLVWLACLIPLVAGVLVLGQDLLLLVPVFLLVYLALKRQWDYVAGLLLGVGLFRFEIILPFAFIFLLRRRWKVMAGFFVASVVALLASVALVGWGGLADYARLLIEVGRTTGSEANAIPVAAMPSLRGAVATFLGAVTPRLLLFPVIVIGTLALLGWAARQFKNMADPENPSFDLEFSLATLAALLASYHLFVHELTPLIVVGYLILGFEGAHRREGILGNRQGTALLLIFALVYGVGGAVFHFRDFSVLFIVLLGMMVWLSQEIAALRRRSTAS